MLSCHVVALLIALATFFVGKRVGKSRAIEQINNERNLTVLDATILIHRTSEIVRNGAWSTYTSKEIIELQKKLSTENSQLVDDLRSIDIGKPWDAELRHEGVQLYEELKKFDKHKS